MKRLLTLLALGVLVSACGVTAKDDSRNTSRSEDVVDVGYGKVARSDLTTSVSSVDIPENPISYRDIYEMIEGKCAGVQVEGHKITIRGMNSAKGGTDPLFIVNGVPYESVDWVNPNDVKSIDVLKDAGSTAIYGFRGANGVIIINLK